MHMCSYTHMCVHIFTHLHICIEFIEINKNQYKSTFSFGKDIKEYPPTIYNCH